MEKNEKPKLPEESPLGTVPMEKGLKKEKE
jgi:hypothetical protein